MSNNNNNFYHFLNTPLSNRSDVNEAGSIGSSSYTVPHMSSVASSNNYSISRSTPSNSMTTVSYEADPIVPNGNTSSQQQTEQRRKIMEHLVLLLHAHKCLQLEKQAMDNNNNNSINGDQQRTSTSYSCTLPYCETMRSVLQHMTKCSDFKNCSFNYCVRSRHILLHWRNCTSSSCLLCGSLKRHGTTRGNHTINREWQKKLSTDHRSFLVKKIVSSLLETIKQDIRSLSSQQLESWTTYAQKLELEIFNQASSSEDYFQSLAERIYRASKDFEEKQANVRQRSIISSLTSIDKSAGELGPPNRTAPSTDLLPTPRIKNEPEVGQDNNNSIFTDDSLLKNTVTPHTNGESSLETNGIHEGLLSVKKEQVFNDSYQTVNKNSAPVGVKREEHISKESTSTNVSSTASSSVPIDASRKSLPKHPAQFHLEDIRQKMWPILERMYNHDDGGWFRQPVTETIAPGYFDIIKNPMDFSTIMRKFNENQYSTPFQFCEDVWLVFNNTWKFNKKSHRVYKAATKLSEIFVESVDPIMKDYGYCCGRQYVFLPSAMFCYGVNGNCCTIPRDGDYFVYNNLDPSRPNLSGEKYTFCKKCFDSAKSEYIQVGDDPAQTLVEIPKAKFLPAKNDYQEQETMTDCIVCSRTFHSICVLYHEQIWPEGYVCQTCVTEYNIKRKENRYLAHKLTTTDLANALEQRVNDFLRRECHPDTGRVTIRVLSASDRICEVKPRLKRYFGLQVPDGYPYRTKAIFAFQEIEGVDVVLFGMHVQEYDGRCPMPNARRVYVSYLDSVHYFRPKEKRTAVYFEILIGYLDYVKKLGFIYAHIWACPPSEGDDYIFYCHPSEQRVPKPKRLQEWYKTMLDVALREGVILEYKDVMKDCADNGITKATDIPYFEGDFWSSTIEELIKELEIEEEDRRKYEESEVFKTSDDITYDEQIEPEEPTEMSDKRKSNGTTTQKKKNFKKTTSQRRAARKNMTNGNDLMSKINSMMEKHKESFFVVRLRNPMANSGTSSDTDPLIQCDLMDSRDAFLNFAREKHCEFSSLRRAKYSTMASLIELHSATPERVSYTCNACRHPCDVRYHCTICEDYDLCSKCYTEKKHPHQMDRTDDPRESKNNNETPANLQQQRQMTIQRMVDVIRHAVQCRNANCLVRTCNQCKILLKHEKECPKQGRQPCPLCKKLEVPIWYHAKTCVDPTCPLPRCAEMKQKLQRQRAATMQLDRRRMNTMHRANMTSNASPINVQPSESTSTPSHYQYAVESSSPSSSGKAMPSGGKNCKPSSMTSLGRSSLGQPVNAQPSLSMNHVSHYNGGKGNPPMVSGPYSITSQNVSSPSSMTPPWFGTTASQQPIRYSAPTGKPTTCPSPRVSYPNDPYSVRQPMPPNSYPYQTNPVTSAYTHQQAMDSNMTITSRLPNQMNSQQALPTRYPPAQYYSHQNSLPYQSGSPAPQPHRSVSQTNISPAYALPTNPVLSNGPGSKSSSVDSIDMKTEEIYEDPNKQSMFYPMLQGRPRPTSTTFYSNMQPGVNAYYSTQRPLTPTTEYGMPHVRGPAMRSSSIPPQAYGTVPNQPRHRAQLTSSMSDLTAGMNPAMMGIPSTPSPGVPGAPR